MTARQDDTAAIAQAAGVRVIRQPNAGPAAARNAGAAAAQRRAAALHRRGLRACARLDLSPGRPLCRPRVAGAKGAYLTRQTACVPRFTQLEYEDRYDRMAGAETIDFVDTYSAAYRRDIFLANARLRHHLSHCLGGRPGALLPPGRKGLSAGLRAPGQGLPPPQPNPAGLHPPQVLHRLLEGVAGTLAPRALGAGLTHAAGAEDTDGLGGCGIGRRWPPGGRGGSEAWDWGAAAGAGLAAFAAGRWRFLLTAMPFLAKVWRGSAGRAAGRRAAVGACSGVGGGLCPGDVTFPGRDRRSAPAAFRPAADGQAAAGPGRWQR